MPRMLTQDDHAHGRTFLAFFDGQFCLMPRMLTQDDRAHRRTFFGIYFDGQFCLMPRMLAQDHHAHGRTFWRFSEPTFFFDETDANAR